VPVAVSGIAILVASLVAAIAGVGEFDAFPAIRLEAGPSTFALCGIVVALAAAPFALRMWRSRG
jgi:hypothetical protein